jgi:ribosomal protein L25 (general stress protein Ctc)
MTHDSIIKTLHDYPGIIAEIEDDYYHDKQNCKVIEEKISLFNAELQLLIALDPEFKNEQIRKAQFVKNQIESQEYRLLQTQLEKATKREYKTLIKLERHKREYSVLKLDMQMAIARYSPVLIDG